MYVISNYIMKVREAAVVRIRLLFRYKMLQTDQRRIWRSNLGKAQITVEKTNKMKR